MDQLLVWTVVYTQEIQGRRRRRNWEELYYGGFGGTPGASLPRSALRLAARLFSVSC